VDQANEVNIVCPACNSSALYKYGHVHGSQRYICLMCNRQFVLGQERIFPKSRPLCPHCGRSMYLFRSKEAHDTFRCARYPECRTYVRVAKTAPARGSRVARLAATNRTHR
jgi:transposase-like protein